MLSKHSKDQRCEFASFIIQFNFFDPSSVAPLITTLQFIQPQLDLVFYVYLSDGFNFVSVTQKFDGFNYTGWNKSSCRASGAKNKILTIDGSIPITDYDDLNFSLWKIWNNLVDS